MMLKWHKQTKIHLELCQGGDNSIWNVSYKKEKKNSILKLWISLRPESRSSQLVCVSYTSGQHGSIWRQFPVVLPVLHHKLVRSRRLIMLVSLMTTSLSFSPLRSSSSFLLSFLGRDILLGSASAGSISLAPSASASPAAELVVVSGTGTIVPNEWHCGSGTWVTGLTISNTPNKFTVAGRWLATSATRPTSSQSLGEGYIGNTPNKFTVDGRWLHRRYLVR